MAPPPPLSPAPDAVARFAAGLAALPGVDISRAQRLGVAVSGGPDSLALLLLAHAARPGAIAAATVDHGLRPESAGEAAHVAAICARIGVPHAILTPRTPITGSLQAAARVARYALLEEWRRENAAACVMTAHHADDQAETLLMRLNRGAGIAGLAGIRRVNGFVVRPLLGWRRAELAAIVGDCGLAACDDPSNRDDRFDRVRIRRELEDADWIDPTALAASASHLADGEEAIAWSARRLAEERLSGDGETIGFSARDLPVELRRRLVLAALARIDPGCLPSGPALDRLIETLESGGQASMGEALCAGGEVWRFSPAPPRRGGNRPASAPN